LIILLSIASMAYDFGDVPQVKVTEISKGKH
jgi:hypothetical protein